MSILSGFLKTKRRRLTDEGYILQSEWTSASTVEFDDGMNAEEKIQDIEDIMIKNTDIVDNLESTATDLPLSANMGRELKDKMTHSEYVLMQQYTQAGTYAMDFSQYKKIAISLVATNIYADTRIFDVDLITSGCLGPFNNTILAGTVFNSSYYAVSVFVIKRNQLEIKSLSSPQANCTLSVYGIK